MKPRILKLGLEKWAPPENWPKDVEFAVMVIADGMEQANSGYDKLILNAIQKGACSIYFWGPQASNAEDIAVFAVAEHEVLTGKNLEPKPGYMTVVFSDTSAEETISLVNSAYLPDAVENESEATLIVFGLRSSPFWQEFCRSLDGLAP